jgi:hypothetical protein
MVRLGTSAHRPVSTCLSVCLRLVCPSLFCRSDRLANPIACAPFRCLKLLYSSIRESFQAGTGCWAGTIFPKASRVSQQLPGRPQDLSDSDDESSGDELDVRQDPETLAHATNRPPLQLIPRLKYSTLNPPPRDANIITLAVQTIRTAARQPQHI